MHNEAGQVVHATAAKLGTLEEIEVEIAGFNRDAKRLPLGFFPPLTETVDRGACGAAGAFYTLAEGYDRSLFDLLATSDAGAAGVIGVMRQRMKIWTDASAMKRATVAGLRRRVIGDESYQNIVKQREFEFGDIEGEAISFRECCVHGDLHGANVLLDVSANPILIDFGDVGLGPACLDPITLDLSAVFHPDAVRLGLSGKILPRLAAWPDPDAFEAGHPFPAFAKACREWAYDVAGNDLTVLAVAYGYVVRQLRFATVASEATEALLNAIVDRIRSS
jgi:hypothetical protein